MNIAFAHSAEEGAAALSGNLELLLQWSFDPSFLLPLVLALLYFRGLRRIRRQGGRILPRWRPVCFSIGVGVMALALLSPIDPLADQSFAWHMVQHMLLTMVAAPFFLLGAPFLPVVRGLPEGFRRRVFVPFARNRAVRWFFITITQPLAGLLIYMAALWSWHDARLYDLALHNETAHYLEHLCFVVTAGLFWWNVVSPWPFTSRLGYIFRMAYIFVASLQNTALGALITFSGHAWYAYSGLGGFWGLTAEEDQLIGGLMMWVGGGMMHLIAMTTVFVVYARMEARKEPPRLLYIDREPPQGAG